MDWNEFMESMEDAEREADNDSDLEKFAPIEPEVSPYLPRNLINLFLRPTKFFTDHIALGKTPFFLLTIFAIGAFSAIDNSERLIGGTPSAFSRMLGGNWFAFWGYVLVLGFVIGFLVWFIGGWWYSVRLGWCGTKKYNRKKERLVYIYATLVQTLPYVLYVMCLTVIYPDGYQNALKQSGNLIPGILLLVFPLWSYVVSYKGVVTVFKPKKGMAQLWFLILPILFYVLFTGLAILVPVLTALNSGI
jgi:hypothetical protein